MIKEYREKSNIFQVIQWTGHNQSEVGDFLQKTCFCLTTFDEEEDCTLSLTIHRQHHIWKPAIGDYLVRNTHTNGLRVHCPEFFKLNYERVPTDKGVEK